MKKLWDNIWLRLLVTLALIVLIVWACYALREILIPLALAFIVAYIFHPLVDYLEQRKIPRVATIAALLILLVAAFAGSLFVFIPRLIRESASLVETFRENLPEMQKHAEALVERFADSALAERLRSHVREFLNSLQTHIPKILETGQSMLIDVVSGTVGVVGAIANFLLFAVVSVYLLIDFNKITANARDLIPPAKRESTLRILGNIDLNLKSFFRGQIITCTILAVIYGIGLSIVGVPFALLIAIVGGYGQIVPYLGTTLAIVPAAVLALIEYGDLIHPLGAIAVFVIGQSLEGFVITPKIMGETVGLHPVAIILAILIFAKLLGFLGVLLAVPLAAVLKVVVAEALVRYKESSLFSDSDA